MAIQFDEILYPVTVAALIIGATALLVWLLRMFWSKTSLGKSPSSRAILSYIVIIIWIIGIILAISSLKLDVTVLLVLLGAASIAVVLASRDILQNRVSHDLLLVAPLFKIGDWIEIDGRYGRVVEMKNQTTTLVSHDNEIYIIPNSHFFSSITTNRSSKSPKVIVPFKVKVKEDIGEFERKLLSMINERCADALAPDTRPEMFINLVTERELAGDIRVTINNIGKQKSISTRINKILSELVGYSA